jgi:steroid delta-isomerase-like uncharacterized protein
MSAENKAIVRRFVDEILNKMNWKVADEIIAPGFKFHFTSRPEPLNRQGFEQTLIPFHQGFPDIRFNIDDLIAEGNQVAARFTMTGTHRGEFQGLAPTGKHARWTGIAVFRIVAGQIVEEWPMPDVLSLLRQLETPPG